MDGLFIPHNGAPFTKDGLELPRFSTPISENSARARFVKSPALSATQRAQTCQVAYAIAGEARRAHKSFSAEGLMAIYKLSTPEGRMLMELAEALLRIPDKATRDFLIRDKLAGGHWVQDGDKGFLNGAKYALELAGKMTCQSEAEGLSRLVARLGMPTLRQAVEKAMHILGRQFVYAEGIERAVAQAARSGQLFSFDMLGEAARSFADETRYYAAYEAAIHAVGKNARNDDPNQNSGVSIKLSALSCRFRTRYWPEAATRLGQSVVSLVRLARHYNIPITIDAEEAGRLQPTLAIFRCLLAQPDIATWPGLGIVVQAYGRRAGQVIEFLIALAKQHKTRIAVRLVKGAYWDSEIKIAQEKGLSDFPVYTQKNNTDLAYLAHARQLLGATSWVHPQFATHNAHTLAAICCLAEAAAPTSFEIQKLHGMGDAVHQALAERSPYRLRTYAPVGRHDDLLAYLVRRLLENGANSSFMNKVSDTSLTIDDLVSDPYSGAIGTLSAPLVTGAALFQPRRQNSHGFDEDDATTLTAFYQNMAGQKMAGQKMWAKPKNATLAAITQAFDDAGAAGPAWQGTAPKNRAQILNEIARLYELHASELYQLLTTEAGKTFDDAVGELREAVDFCRYYAAEAARFNTKSSGRGVVVAISPWNFPLAIFTGQIVAALAAGNTVIAKPAEQTPRIANLACRLMHAAGLPQAALHLLCGAGSKVGAALVSHGRADMVVFTGSTQTAKRIEAAIATSGKPHIPLIAETGGLNAMIVDASALLERAVDDIVTSAFKSAGQRCSALRVLYVQDDIAAPLTEMIIGATSALKTGRPDSANTDIGPVIDAAAKDRIETHVENALAKGDLIWRGQAPKGATYCAPALVRITGIADLETEVFGPVLHIAPYPAGGEAAVVAAINNAGYGLTFGIHSRIDANINAVVAGIEVGNIYVNRNQIGAVVGSQPFGGEGLSGTGPKAGGPLYLPAFGTNAKAADSDNSHHDHDTSDTKKNSGANLPGPDGEDNVYTTLARGTVLVTHPDATVRRTLSARATAKGNHVIEDAGVPRDVLEVDAVLTAPGADISQLRQWMNAASSTIIPLIMDQGADLWLRRERHICRDLTASGGNLALLSR